MKIKKIIAAFCAAAAVLSLAGCELSDTPFNSSPTSARPIYSSSKPMTTSTSTKLESKSEISEPESEPVSVPESEPEISLPQLDPSIIRPEVKEAIDSYEDFIDEYCDFMKKMSQTDNAGTMMLEYLEYTQKLTEMGEKFDKISYDDLTDAEVAYYTEVMLRCNQKMLKW